MLIFFSLFHNIKYLSIFFLPFTIVSSIYATEPHIIKVAKCDRDATSILQNAIDSARKFNGYPVVIELAPGDYNLSRKKATEKLYHLSNTASKEEYPDQTRHIGIFIKDLNNLKIKGNGTRIVTHGEMTSFAIDSCDNICLEDLTFTAADPTVTEIRILEVSDTSFTFEPLPSTNYEINDGLFRFIGDGWSFGDAAYQRNAIAQVFYPEKNVTKRCTHSPINGYSSVSQISPGVVRMYFDKAPSLEPGDIYQFRHSIRNEVCGFINLSKDITLNYVNFNFMGNFGLLSQYSENISLQNIRCAPEDNSGRTNAGFADFLHFSGCKGKIKIIDSFFCGAQDDAINVHGTFLKVMEQINLKKFKVRFMHSQTFGFTPFFRGDEVEIVNASTLNPIHIAHVTKVEKIDDYNFSIEIDSPLSLPENYEDDLVVENVSYTPEVEIIGNHFERIPTRGILLTTRKKSLIEKNTFFKLPMAAILVADDANSWYESGRVCDLTIRDNTFFECSQPVIKIEPEIKRFEQPVHKGIIIEDNNFYGDSENFISFKGDSEVVVKDNNFFILNP